MASSKLMHIQRAAKACGSNWFSPGAMRFFKTRLGREFVGGGGTFFTTSDQGPNMRRMYTVRQWKPENCQVDTPGTFQRYRTASGAAAAARKAAKQGPQVLTGAKRRRRRK